MNNFSKKIISLIKINLTRLYNIKLLVSLLMLLVMPGLVRMLKISEYTKEFSKSTNCWDYFFYVFTSVGQLMWVIIPVMVFLTGILLKDNTKDKYIYLRGVTKTQIIISKQLSNLFIVAVSILSSMIVIFSISVFLGGFQLGWSEAITSEKILMKAGQRLYPNNFIEGFSVVSTLIISYILFVFTTYLVILLRDMIFYITKKYYASTIAVFIYILSELSGLNPVEVLSLQSLGTMWCHKYSFGDSSIFEGMKIVTLTESNLILFGTIFIMLLITIFAFRRKEIEGI